MKNPGRILLLITLFVLTPNLARAQSVELWRRDYQVSLANPIERTQTLILVNDLFGDGRLQAVRRYTDLHQGKDAEFRIYQVLAKNNRGEMGEELARIRTRDDYCHGIELRDIDGDGQYELVFRTLGRDGIRRGLHIARIDREQKTVTVLNPDKAFGQEDARFEFSPKTASGPASLTVISISRDQPMIFSPIQAVAGQTPSFWLRQVYQIEPFVLRQSESLMHETPFYVLSKTLQALQARDVFAAYKYAFSDVAYHEYKKATLENFPHLCARQTKSRYELIEWGLEFYRDVRIEGWLTFTHTFEEGGRQRSMSYQAFMRKVYDEWKITLIRKIRES